MFLKAKKLVSLSTIFALLGAEQAKASFNVIINGFGYNSEYLSGEGNFVGEPTDEGFEMQYRPLQHDHSVSATASYRIRNGPYDFGICTIFAANDIYGGPRVTAQSSDEENLACDVIPPPGAKPAQQYAFHSAMISTMSTPIGLGVLGAIYIAVYVALKNKKEEEELAKGMNQEEILKSPTSSEESLEILGESVHPRKMEENGKEFAQAVYQLAEQFADHILIEKVISNSVEDKVIERFAREELNKIRDSNSNDRVELLKAAILNKLRLPAARNQRAKFYALALVRLRAKYDQYFDLPLSSDDESSDTATIEKDKYKLFVDEILEKGGLRYDDIFFPTIQYFTYQIGYEPSSYNDLASEFFNFEEINHIAYRDVPAWHQRFSFRFAAGLFGFGVLLATPISTWFGIRGTQAKDLNFEVKVGRVASPLPGKKLNFVSKLASGGVGLVDGYVALLGGPHKYSLLVDKGFENNAGTNSEHYPVFQALAGKATGLPEAYYDEATEQTLLAIPTGKGLSIVKVDHSAQVQKSNTPSNVLFAGKRVGNLKLVSDAKSKRLVALFTVEEQAKEEAVGKESKPTKVYMLANDAPSFSELSCEQDFIELKHAAVDKDNNIYYAFAGEKGLKVLKPQGSSEQTLMASGLPGSVEVQRVEPLPAGGVLAFTNEGLYHAVSSGQFARVPPSVLSLNADDFIDVISLSKAGATGEQVSKVLFYPAHALERGHKGALLVTMPVGGTSASWQVEKVFADEYVGSFQKDSSIVTTIKLAEAKKKVKNYYLSSLKSDAKNTAIREISAASYTPEVGSSSLVYALKPKGVLLVDRSSGMERLLAQTSEQTIEQIKMLANSGRLAFIGKLISTSEPILQITDKDGRELQTLKFKGEKISSLSVFSDDTKDGRDALLVSTSNGLQVYKENTAGEGYKLAFHFFEGTFIDASYVDAGGKLTVYSHAAFSSGFKFNTPFVSLSQESADELDGEVLGEE